MIGSLITTVLTVGAVAIAPGLVPAGSVADGPPSIAQLCAATGIEEVDALLDGVASTELVGALSPLASLVVPARDSVELDASVQLNDVRQRLNCDRAPATTSAAPTVPVPVPADPDEPGFTQLDRVPTGAAETGGGPA